MIDCNFVYRRYPATLLILVVNVPTSPGRKCNIPVYDTALQPIYPTLHYFNEFSSHACWLSVLNFDILSTPTTTEGRMTGSFNSLNCENRSVRTSIYSLFCMTRATKIIAPVGTQHLPHARQAPYPLAMAHETLIESIGT